MNKNHSTPSLKILGDQRSLGNLGTPDSVVSVSCLKHIYPDTTEIHMCGLDFIVNRGERIAVLGGNGSGKTTLLFHILGLLSPNEGRVSVFGVNPAERYGDIRERIGVLLQNVDEQLLSPTVIEDVSFSARNYGYEKEETERLAVQALEALGIAHLQDKICHYLSGGEKRKVALAGAISLHPELLILDEPFEGLDNRSRSELVSLLNALNEKGMTIIMSTHDLNLVAAFADRVYVLARGRGVVTAGTPSDIFMQVEALRASNIDPPLLTELFMRLRERGITIDIPIHLEDAVNAVVRLAGSEGPRNNRMPT